MKFLNVRFRISRKSKVYNSYRNLIRIFFKFGKLLIRYFQFQNITTQRNVEIEIKWQFVNSVHFKNMFLRNLRINEFQESYFWRCQNRSGPNSKFFRWKFSSAYHHYASQFYIVYYYVLLCIRSFLHRIMIIVFMSFLRLYRVVTVSSLRYHLIVIVSCLLRLSVVTLSSLCRLLKCVHYRCIFM